MRVQRVVEQIGARVIESRALRVRAGGPVVIVRLRRVRQLVNRELGPLVRHGHVPQEQQAKPPEHGPRIIRKVTTGAPRIARRLLDDFPTARQAGDIRPDAIPHEVLIGHSGRVVVIIFPIVGARNHAERVKRPDVADIEMRPDSVRRIAVSHHLQDLGGGHVMMSSRVRDGRRRGAERSARRPVLRPRVGAHGVDLVEEILLIGASTHRLEVRKIRPVGILQARHGILEAIRQAIPILVGHGGAEDNRAPREAIIAAVPRLMEDFRRRRFAVHR